MTKICSCCKISKSIHMFGKNKATKDGKDYYCKKCIKLKTEKRKEKVKEYNKRYYKNNKEKYAKTDRKYYSDNKEKMREYHRNWYQKNKEKVIKRKTEYITKKRKSDPLFRLKESLRTRLYMALKSKKWTKTNSFSEYIGCEFEYLVFHLEEQFQEGMTWDNKGEWHIDHIVPLSSASNEEEMYALCHYSNLQPLWAIDNMRKGSKK